MSIKDEIGARMKDNYEKISNYKLTRRTPVIIRIDGKAFHTFTRGFKKPFDQILMKTMHNTMKYLCENIQGCVLGYTQSDEISLLLVDYKKITSSAWFDNEIQKICSISASMATMAFNKEFTRITNDYINDSMTRYVPNEEMEYITTLEKAVYAGAMFDARCFNIPKEEVANYFYWRQLDATRNSIQMVGQAEFSHKELQGKSCNDIQEMLHEQKGINWNDFTVPEKRGVYCIKTEDGWVIDNNIPIFKNDDRRYIESLVWCEEDKERYIPWIDDIEQAIDVAEEEAKDECCTKEEYSAINYFVYVLKKFLKLEGNMSEEIKNAYKPTEKIKEEIK